MQALGYNQLNKAYFDTLRIALPQEVSTQHLQSVALSKEVNLRYFDNGDVGSASMKQLMSVR
jgi:glycine dehydrogenase